MIAERPVESCYKIERMIVSSAHTQKPLTALSLFSGAGGMDIGIRAGSLIKRNRLKRFCAATSPHEYAYNANVLRRCSQRQPRSRRGWQVARSVKGGGGIRSRLFRRVFCYNAPTDAQFFPKRTRARPEPIRLH